jgi:hypothetical protein
MSSSPSTRFGERYVLEVFPAGDGVLLDLATGSYFRLNASAVCIGEALSTCASEQAAIDRVATKLGLGPAEAARSVEDFLSGVAVTVPLEIPPSPLHFDARPDGTAVFLERGRPILSIDPAKRIVALEAPVASLPVRLALYLQSVMPKLLSLLDVPILHAAASELGGQLVAFSGKSGAGKTTTARAFAKTGIRLVSEDLLILNLSAGELAVHVDGEPLARAWARGSAERLQTPGDHVEYTPLLETARGPTRKLDAVWLIDAARRAGSDFSLRKLPLGDAVTAMLGNGILASTQPSEWRAFFRRVRQVAERTLALEATMPDGLERLEQAVTSYRSAALAS